MGKEIDPYNSEAGTMLKDGIWKMIQTKPWTLSLKEIINNLY